MCLFPNTSVLTWNMRSPQWYVSDISYNVNISTCNREWTGSSPTHSARYGNPHMSPIQAVMLASSSSMRHSVPVPHDTSYNDTFHVDTLLQLTNALSWNKTSLNETHFTGRMSFVSHLHGNISTSTCIAAVNVVSCMPSYCHYWQLQFRLLTKVNR